MYKDISQFVNEAVEETEISDSRKAFIADAAQKISSHKSENPTLLFVCTHNSRRSQLAHVWADVFNQTILGTGGYHIQSAGTEVTACNPRTVAALEEIGFEVGTNQGGDNPVYHVKFDKTSAPVKLWSKTVIDEGIQQPVIAIMTCSHADENCPFIPGALERIPLTYVDPKRADDTDEEMEIYLETAALIAAELHYMFSLIK